MLTKKLLVFLIIFILILPSISLNVLSHTESNNADSDKNPGLIMRLLKARFYLGFIKFLYIGKYFYQQLRPPVPIQAYPDAVDLRYLNVTIIKIGGKNPETLEWEPMVKVAGGWSWAWWNPRTIYSFEFVPPEDAPGDVWNVQFDPEKLVMDTNTENLNWPGATQPFRTNVTIMLKPSLDPTYPSQDVVLKVNVVREEILDHLRIVSGAPKWVKNNIDEYYEKQKSLYPDSKPIWNPVYVRIYRVVKWAFLFLNLRFPSYDKWVDSTVDILIRVNKYHQAKIIPPPPLDIKPYEVKSIPVTIQNLGSHIDTFNFRVKTSDKNIFVTPPPAITIKPGEEVQALVGVAAPKTFLSIGSTTSIFLEAYSVDDPNSVFSNTIILSTIGVYTAGSPTYNFVLILITLLVIIGLIIYFTKKRREKISKKPEKPWNIPEEKQYLEKLKEKDKQKYIDTIDMMKDEYKSALLWHKYYCDDIIRKNKSTKRKIELKIDFKKLTNQFAKIKELGKKVKKIKFKTKKKKPKVKKEKIKIKKEEIPEKKIVEEPKIIEEVKSEEVKPKEIKKKERVVDKKAELEKIRRERVISRVRRLQEKQIKKLSD